MARLPPSRDALHRSIRVPNLRKGDHSPLRSFPPLARLAICPFPWLPTQRICRCGHNATCLIPSPPCVSVSRALWFSSCHAVPAAGPFVKPQSSRMSDAVRLRKSGRSVERSVGPPARNELKNFCSVCYGHNTNKILLPISFFLL